MEAYSSLVRSDGAVHLNTISLVDVDFTTVVHPRYTEHNYSFRLNHSFQYLEIHKIRIGCNIRCDTFHYFSNCLMEFSFAWILGDEFGHKAIYIVSRKLVHNFSLR